MSSAVHPRANGVNGVHKESVEVGLDVLRRLREADDLIPLAVHTVQKVSTAVVKEILGRRASYLKTKEDSQLEAFAQSIPLLAAGYIVCCGTAATSLQKCLSPDDPLSPAEWDICSNLAQGQLNKAVADSLEISERSFQNALVDIATKLEKKALIKACSPEHDTSGHVHRTRLIAFYRANHEHWEH